MGKVPIGDFVKQMNRYRDSTDHFLTPEENDTATKRDLEREVIEKAKAWKLKRDDGDNEKWSVHYVEMCEAIQALIEFEANQQTTK